MVESDWLAWFPHLATDWSGNLACLTVNMTTVMRKYIHLVAVHVYTVKTC